MPRTYEIDLFYGDNDCERDALVVLDCFDDNAAVDHAKILLRRYDVLSSVMVSTVHSSMRRCIEVIYRDDLDFDHNANRAAFYANS